MKKTTYKISLLTAASFFLRWSVFILSIPYEFLFEREISVKTLIIPDIALLALTAILSCFVYKSTSLIGKKSTLNFTKGVVIRRSILISHKSLRSISVTRSPLHLFSSSSEVRLNGNTFLKKVLIQKKSARLLLRSAFPDINKSKNARRTPLSALIISSIDLTHSIAGLVAALSFLRFSSRFFQLTDALKLAESIDRELLFILRFLPYSLRLFAFFLLILWGVLTLSNLTKILRHRFFRQGGVIKVMYGLIPQVTFVFSERHITAHILTAGVVGTLLRRRTLWAHIPQPENGGNIPLMLGEKTENCYDFLEKKLPTGQRELLRVTPAANSRWAYCIIPIVLLCTLSAICIVPKNYLPLFLSAEIFLPLFSAGIFLFYFAHFRFTKTYCALTPDLIKIRTFKGVLMQEAFIPRENIIAAQICAGPIKRIFGKCNLKIYVRSSRPLTFTLPYAEKKKAAQLLKLLCD